MSSSPPAPAKEHEEVKVETADGEAPSPLQAVEACTGVVDGGAAANHTTSFSHEEAAGSDDGDDQEEDMHSSEGDHVAPDDDMVMDGEEEDEDDDMVDLGSDEEGGPVSLQRAEFEATVEALWRKVVGVVEEKPSAPVGHTCLVCMEPLTCEGHHRIW